MLLIDENRLQNQTIELIGLNYGLKQDKKKNIILIIQIELQIHYSMK